MDASGSTAVPFTRVTNACVNQPARRHPSQRPKYELWNAIRSNTAIASGGSTAQRNAERRAQAETSRSQP